MKVAVTMKEFYWINQNFSNLTNLSENEVMEFQLMMVKTNLSRVLRRNLW